jgi:hypothetical protein
VGNCREMTEKTLQFRRNRLQSDKKTTKRDLPGREGGREEKEEEEEGNGGGGGGEGEE